MSQVTAVKTVQFQSSNLDAQKRLLSAIAHEPEIGRGLVKHGLTVEYFDESLRGIFELLRDGHDAAHLERWLGGALYKDIYRDHAPDPWVIALKKNAKQLEQQTSAVIIPLRPQLQSTVEPVTLNEVIALFQKWLILKDVTPIYAVLGAVAANVLDGEPPVWIGIIAPPSSAKTEILNSITRLPYVYPVGTLSPAALLSGTPQHQASKDAKGGLLCKIGEFGILVLKDFGSILSMRPDAKTEVIAALREVYDGAWTRHLGTDGGKTMAWSGKLGLIFASTEVYDDHYGIIGSLGDRFLLCRLDPSYEGQLEKAFAHAGPTSKAMRAELANAVAGLFAPELKEPQPLSAEEFRRLDRVVNLAVRLRAHVNRSRLSREIESVHGHEGPARMGLSLGRLFAGLNAIGLDRTQAMTLVEEIALSSVPPLRRNTFEQLCWSPEGKGTREVAQALGLPTNTVRRALEDLEAYGLISRSREQKGLPDTWAVNPQWGSVIKGEPYPQYTPGLESGGREEGNL
jgi:hypothetical protein